MSLHAEISADRHLATRAFWIIHLPEKWLQLFSPPKYAAIFEASQLGRVSNNIQNLNMELDSTWKINMEPTNHPFGKENDLSNLHHYVPC